MSDPGRAPGKWLYFVAALLPLLGAAVAARQVIQTIDRYQDAYRQVVVPGETTLHLDAAGSYTIFHEYVSNAGGRVFSGAQEVPGLLCKITDKATGRELALRPPGTHTTYSLGGREGVSLFALEIPAPGDYVLAAAYPEGSPGADTVLAIGLDNPFAIAATVFGTIAVLGLASVLGAALALWTFLRRRGTLGPRRDLPLTP